MIWQVLVDPAVSGRLCLTLLHSVWQAALVASVARCCEWLPRSGPVERRYAVHVSALLVLLTALPVTYVWLGVARRPGEAQSAAPTVATAVRAGTISGSSVAPESESPVALDTFVDTILPRFGDDSSPDARSAAGVPSLASRTIVGASEGWLPLGARWIVVGYLGGVVLMLARLLVSTVKANRLVARAQRVTSGPLVGMLRSLADKWAIRVVPALARTEQAVVPAVVGLVRPTILLPASAISGLTTGELEMILVHELAHVRRYDMWINLIQRLAEAVLFFNPGLWYLSRRVSRLREYCCDEMTCGALPGPASEPRVRYAMALLRVVELARPSVVADGNLASLAFSGRTPSETRRRVARLFGEPLREPLRVSRGGVLTLFVLAAALTVGLPVWSRQAERAPGQTDAGEPFVFLLQVVGPDGSPLAGASVEIRMVPKPTADQILRGAYVRAGNYGAFTTTDPAGRLEVLLPSRAERFNLSIKQPGHGPYWAGWSSAVHPQAIPREFTAELDEGWSVGGVALMPFSQARCCSALSGLAMETVPATQGGAARLVPLRSALGWSVVPLRGGFA